MTHSKSVAILLTVATLAASVAHGQGASPPIAGASKPAGQRPMDAHSGQALTSAELAKMNTILAQYKSANLTAGDAKAIKRALRDAGMRRSRELDAALNNAGFSPEKLDALDPPPPRPPGDANAPPKK